MKFKENIEIELSDNLKENYGFLVELLNHRELEIENIKRKINKQGTLKTLKLIQQYNTMLDEVSVLLRLIEETAFSYERYTYAKERRTDLAELCNSVSKALHKKVNSYKFQ